MGNVYVDRLTTGMVLNSDVKDQTGRLLLKAGTELTEKHLYIFRSWGITEADIAGTTGEGTGVASRDSVDPEKIAAAEAALEVIFPERVRAHPAMRELFRICALRKARVAC